MGIILLDRKFLYENRNGSDFSIDTGDTTTIWKGNVIDRVKDTTTFSVSVEAVVTSFDSNQFEITDFDGTRKKVTRLSGSFITDDILPGDIIDLTNEATSTIIIADSPVDTVTDIFLIVVTTESNATFTDASIRVKQDFTELNFTFTTNAEGSVLEQDSITEAIQQFKNNTVGLDPGGGRVTTFSTSNARNPKRWLTELTDGYKIRFVGDIDDYTQEFEYEHIFTTTHYFEEGQKSNLDNLNSPNPFKNSTLQYRTFFDIGSAQNAGSLRRLEIEVVGSDSVGWLNENFDGGENVYTLTSVAYEKVSDSTPLTEIEVTESTKVTFVITAAAGTTFVTGDPITLAHSKLPTAQLYRNNIGNYNGIWIFENLRTTIDAATIVGTGIIRKLDVNLTSAQIITGSFETLFTANEQKNLSNTDLYLLAAVVESTTAPINTNNTSNRVTLKIDSNIYAKNSDVPGLVIFDSARYYSHLDNFNPSVIAGFTNFTLANEDGFLSTYRFHIVTSTVDQIRIEEMFAITAAFNTVTKEFFEIQRVSIPVPTGNLGKTGGFLRHLVNLDSTRDFNLADGDQFNQMVIETDNFSSPDQFYNVVIGQKLDWQDYLPLDGVDPVFLDANEPNDGLNRKTSRYSGSNDYVIRAGLIVNVSFRGVTTLYLHFSANSTVNDYEESTFTAILESFDSSGADLEGKLLQFERNKFKVTYDDTTVKTNPAEFESIERIQKEFQPGFSNFELSTLRNAVPDTILEGPTDPLLGDKSIENDDFVETGIVRGDLLSLENYTLSARLFEIVAFDSSRSIRLDGTNERIDCGNDSSLDFERTDTFSISAWINLTTIDRVNTIISKQDATSPFKGYTFRVENDNKLRCLIQGGAGLSISVETSSLTLAADTWFHLVMTYDGSSLASGVTLYVDNSPPALSVLLDTLGANSISTTTSLQLGSRDSTAATAYAGFLDEISVWDIELSVGQVNEIYNGGCPNDLNLHSDSGDIVSWWPIDENDDATASTGNIEDKIGVNDGTPENTEPVDLDNETPC